MSSDKTLVLVDGSSLAFRSFYALFSSGLRTTDGTPTWAVIGFFNSLFDLIEKNNPHLLAICFDLAAPTFRHIEFKDYKAHRAEMPDDLVPQWELIKKGVSALNIPLYEEEGFEADDVIGTVAKAAEAKGYNVLIFTGDQDAFQLLDNGIRVLMPSTKEGLLTYGRQEVYNKLGIYPEQVIDYKALCGDTSDNIPGVRGIGPKTAVSLLTQFQTLETIYEHLDQVSSMSVRTKLTEGRESAFTSKMLATIRLDVPVNFDFEHCELTLPPAENVAGFFRTVESSSILKRLPRVLARFNNGVAPQLDPALFSPVIISRAHEALETRTAGGESAHIQQKLESVLSDSIACGEVRIIHTDTELDSLLSELSKQTVVSLQILSTGTQPVATELSGLSFAWAGQTQDINTAYVALPPPHVQLPAQLKDFFANAAIGKIIFNAKAAMNTLATYGIELKGLAFDPHIASYVVNPDEKHTLSDQCQRLLNYHLNVPESASRGSRRAQKAEVLPLNLTAAYACDCARAVFRLHKYYDEHMDHNVQELLSTMELPLVSVLSRMEQTGIKLDLPYFQQLSVQLKGKLTTLESNIFALAGHPFNINSPLQLQKVLFEELGLPSKGRTKSGFSTDISVLEALSGDHAIIAELIEYRHLSKLLSTYVESLPAQLSPADGRLHGEFNQVATSTGRLSSANPNLQNIPIRSELGRAIRQGFVAADAGSLILSADYSQIELRLLAHMSGDPKLIAAFKDDLDIHQSTAMTIFDIAAADVTADQRRIGKTLNFALIYQQGAYSTASALGISAKEAQVFIDKYFSNYPRVKDFLNSIIAEARQRGYVETLWGRRRYFEHLNDRNDNIRRAAERAACNAPLQGSAADLVKLAMIALDKELRARKLRSKLILQVHDELVLDVPEEEIEQIKELVIRAMSLGQPLAVPLKIDITVGKTWRKE